MHHNLIRIVIILLCASSSFGQDALGRGDSLDANSSLLGRSNAQNELPAGTRNIELRRNGILRGRAFDDDIGRYKGDEMLFITDAMNSEDDSYLEVLYNSPWYWNNWDQQSVQFLSQGDVSFFNPNFVDSWAEGPRQMHTGRSIRTFSHAWDSETANRFGGEDELQFPDGWSNRQIEQYRLGQVLGSGYQTPSLDTFPLTVGIHRAQGSIGYLSASPLSGVSLELGQQPFTALGFSAWDAARIAEDQEDDALGSTDLVQAWRVEENRLDQGAIMYRIGVSDQYNKVLEIIASRALDDVADSNDSIETGSWLDEQYALLQTQLAGIPYMPVEDEEDDFGIEELIVEEETVDEIGDILRHGERITQLAGVDSTRFNELLRLGELKLASREYFLAERRFKQALQFIPGHPFATAGLGHSNIGSGMYLSAALVLQSLLSLQPEMIDVEYESYLLPPRLELVRAAVTIQARLDQERDGGTYAFLLAYIGHQLHDVEMVEQGLETLERRTGDTDPLVRLLKSIWLETEPTKNPPAPQSE